MPISYRARSRAEGKKITWRDGIEALWILTRERLLERVWGHESEVDVRSIDAHIRRLRLKLGPARNHVETVVGLGYRFVK